MNGKRGVKRWKRGVDEWIRKGRIAGGEWIENEGWMDGKEKEGLQEVNELKKRGEWKHYIVPWVYR